MIWSSSTSWPIEEDKSECDYPPPSLQIAAGLSIIRFLLAQSIDFSPHPAEITMIIVITIVNGDRDPSDAAAAAAEDVAEDEIGLNWSQFICST